MTENERLADEILNLCWILIELSDKMSAEEIIKKFRDFCKEKNLHNLF